MQALTQEFPTIYSLLTAAMFGACIAVMFWPGDSRIGRWLDG